jgi:hypothetical protein
MWAAPRAPSVAIAGGGDHTVAIRYLPEPSAILLQATGLTSLAALAERRQRRARV